MNDLVDYLRDRLADCSCPAAYSLGRPEIGRVEIKRWSAGCAVHRTAAALEVENERWRNWLMSREVPVPTPRKRRCWHLYGFWTDGTRMHGTMVIAQTKTCLKCGKERTRFRGGA